MLSPASQVTFTDEELRKQEDVYYRHLRGLDIAAPAESRRRVLRAYKHWLAENGIRPWEIVQSFVAPVSL